MDDLFFLHRPFSFVPFELRLFLKYDAHLVVFFPRLNISRLRRFIWLLPALKSYSLPTLTLSTIPSKRSPSTFLTLSCYLLQPHSREVTTRFLDLSTSVGATISPAVFAGNSSGPFFLSNTFGTSCAHPCFTMFSPRFSPKRFLRVYLIHSRFSSNVPAPLPDKVQSGVFPPLPIPRRTANWTPARPPRSDPRSFSLSKVVEPCHDRRDTFF